MVNACLDRGTTLSSKLRASEPDVRRKDAARHIFRVAKAYRLFSTVSSTFSEDSESIMQFGNLHAASDSFKFEMLASGRSHASLPGRLCSGARVPLRDPGEFFSRMNQFIAIHVLSSRTMIRMLQQPSHNLADGTHAI